MLSALVGLLLAPAAGPPPDRVRAALPALEAHVKTTLDRTDVPGLAVAVVHRDEVVFLKGFGVRKAGGPDPVDADTVFQVASVSKPVTATALAGLVGDGLIRWDDKIADLDPGFRLADPWVSRELTLRDLLCHRSGLPDHAGDRLEDLGVPRADILHRLRLLPPGRFRADYAYTNFGFSAAAFAAARKAGRPWEDLVADRLFRPLGMGATSARFRDYAAAGGRAVGHVRAGAKWEAKFTRDPDAQSPAGGVSSTVRDLSAWVRLGLAGGTLGGRRVVAAEPLAETHRPQIVSGTNPDSGRATFYGLGWNVGYDRDLGTTVSHSGAFALGFCSAVYLLPDADLGVVVLANVAPNGVPEGVALTFLDSAVLGKPRRDWVGFAGGMFDRMAGAEAAASAAYAKPPADPAPPLPAAAYVGTFTNPHYGDLEVAEAGGLVLRLGPKKRPFPLRHHDRDVFVYQPAGEMAGGPSGVAFAVGPDRRAARVVVEDLNAEGMGTFTRAGR
jgi:CubicO group peptidase (beta-lactamase class C family)